MNIFSQFPSWSVHHLRIETLLLCVLILKTNSLLKVFLRFQFSGRVNSVFSYKVVSSAGSDNFTLFLVMLSYLSPLPFHITLAETLATLSRNN